ncbi:period circadian protein homolog 2-like [Pelobates fuscus]|uniref:period circadian protein homolog 2-like n=1 Tax=Pelobates fuscus TaxID=191477 RepID=UPI002FE4C8CB
MPNQCSDQHAGAVMQTTFHKDLCSSLHLNPKDMSLQEHHKIVEKLPMAMPPGSPLHSRGSIAQNSNSIQDTQSVELAFSSLHSPGDLSQQRHNTLIKPPSRSGSQPLPQQLQTCSATMGTTPTGHIAGDLNTEGPSIQSCYEPLGNLVMDPTSGLLYTEELNHKLPPKDLEQQAISLDEMETCNDSSSNELNESDENGKDSLDKSCSDFQPPECSSNAFSLMMADSEHNPSTSGYSSEQPAKAKTQKDLMKLLKELRSYLPPDKRSRGKSSTVASLRYALHCIQQVKANEEYYQLLMVNEELPCGLDVSCYTVEEIANITSEYTKNNMDVFAVAVSLVTGLILYISQQASTVLRCDTNVFSQARFVELLAPQDVSVFYSSTTPYRLPSWSICNGADLGSLDSLEEKSFYCRISCGRGLQREISYQPFRMTPYLIRAQLDGSTSEQLCCVLFAEKVHSGYEAPRIPADKRIFTTTHTPSCLFQDIDERAVPLLGYLPQDLIGSPIILHLHPSDRPLMLAVHKKILQSGGQPFDFSPIRFCARNGEYITIDTSWSSFINPWSRKVSFIIGRHKVRMGPVNEDIFTAPPSTEDQSLQPGVQEITEQIHQLLMQPVHNSSSSGYGSLGSNGSHENPMSAGSSSDSNGNLNEDVKDKHATSCAEKEKHGASSLKSKNQQNPEKQAAVTPVAAPYSNNLITDGSGSSVHPAQLEELPAKPHPYSYQQVNSLDSIIRYLESCSVLASAKRKWVSSCNTLSSTSDDDRVQMQEQNVTLQEKGSTIGMGLQLDDQSLSEIIPKLSGPTSHQYRNSLSLEACKPGGALMSLSEEAGDSHCPLQPPLSSITSLPITASRPCLKPLHVPGPSAIPVLAPLPLGTKAESVVSLTSHCSYSSTIVHVGDKKLQPEIEFEDGPSSIKAVPHVSGAAEKEPCRQLGLTKEVLLAHTQKEENDFLSGFMDTKKLSAFQTRCNSYLHERSGAPRSRCPQGPDTPWKKTGKNRKPKAKRVRPESWDSSSSGIPQPPRQPLPGLNTTAWSQSDTSHVSFPPLPYPMLPAYTMPVFPPQPVPNETPHGPTLSTCPMQPFTAPMFPHVMALVMPNYMYPPNMPPVMYPVPSPQLPFPGQPSSYVPQTPYPAAQPTALPNFSIPQPTFPVPQPVLSAPQHEIHVPQLSYAPRAVQSPYPGQIAPQPILHSAPKTKDGISQCSTPRNPQSPLLFQSRCSSPLQLNLLQLEESQKAERVDGVPGLSNCTTIPPQPSEEPHLHHSRAESPADGQTSDAMSACSDLMDLLLHEDVSCGTCSASSAVSESVTSGSRGHETSRSQTGSSLTSHSSKYFGSVDSSENNKLQRQTQGKDAVIGESAMKYILQDPMWLLMANADEKVMMTYQIPLRDGNAVLREDKEKLKCLQKLQPRFSDEQKKELGEIHPWVNRGGLPQAMEVKDCVYCRERGSDGAEYGEAIQVLELSGILESCD